MRAPAWASRPGQDPEMAKPGIDSPRGGMVQAPALNLIRLAKSLNAP